MSNQAAELTKDKILAMKPGQELNELIDTVLFDREYKDFPCGRLYYLEGRGWMNGDPYSTDISAAWAVVDELNGGRYAFEIGRAGDYFAPDIFWKARFGMSGFVEADTAPEAICKAALIAKFLA